MTDENIDKLINYICFFYLEILFKMLLHYIDVVYN